MTWHRHTLPVLSTLLLWASFPPLDLGFLAWIALVPLTVYAMREKTTWKPFLITWVCGWVFFTCGLEWIRYNVPLGLYLVAIYLGLFPALYVWLVRRFTKHLYALTISAPMIWLALEYVRSHFMSGFPYLLIGYTQHEMFLLIQIADLAGVWLVSALVVFVNAVLARAFLMEDKTDREFRIGAIVAGSLLVCSMIYGAVRTSTMELRDGPDVLVIQPNIPQHVKLVMRDSSTKRAESEEIFDKHVRMSKDAIQDSKPDLIVWPESVMYGGVYLNKKTGEYMKVLGWAEEFGVAAEYLGVPILTGTELLEIGDSRRLRDMEVYVSAILVSPEGEIVGRTDKVHLVPFAEYIPGSHTLPIIKELAFEYMGVKFLEFTRGEGFPTLPAGSERFGVEVCFEAVYPEISREIAGNGAKIAVNISNEGWFRASAELDQMYAMTRFRAVESRIAFVRGTNTGISAFIAPTGEIDAVLEVDGKRKEVEGVLRSRVRVTDSGSLYRQVGDVLAWLAVGFALASLLLSWVRARVQKP